MESEQSVSSVLTELGLEPSTLSQHLAVVKRAGLVESSRRGNTVIYRLAFRSVEQFLVAARTLLAATLGRARLALGEIEDSLQWGSTT